MVAHGKEVWKCIYYRAELLEATRTFVKKMARDFINDMRRLNRNLLRKIISELIDHSRKYHNHNALSLSPQIFA